MIHIYDLFKGDLIRTLDLHEYVRTDKEILSNISEIYAFDQRLILKVCQPRGNSNEDELSTSLYSFNLDDQICQSILKTSSVVENVWFLTENTFVISTNSLQDKDGNTKVSQNLNNCHKTIEVWNIDSERIRCLNNEDEAVRCCCVSSNRQFIATLCNSKFLENACRFHASVNIYSVHNNFSFETFDINYPSTVKMITCDSSTMFITASLDKIIRVWNLNRNHSIEDTSLVTSPSNLNDQFIDNTDDFSVPPSSDRSSISEHPRSNVLVSRTSTMTACRDVDFVVADSYKHIAAFYEKSSTSCRCLIWDLQLNEKNYFPIIETSHVVLCNEELLAVLSNRNLCLYDIKLGEKIEEISVETKMDDSDQMICVGDLILLLVEGNKSALVYKLPTLIMVNKLECKDHEEIIRYF